MKIERMNQSVWLNKKEHANASVKKSYNLEITKVEWIKVNKRKGN